MAYSDDKIKVDAFKRSLNDKVRTDIDNTQEKIYWYLKFNLKLDESSVSNKTTTVTDTEGFIFKTTVRYSNSRKFIIIEPLEPYEEGKYYILHISEEVRSENLQNLKEAVHILFKILNGQISYYKILDNNVTVPTPVERKEPKTKVYLFQKEKSKDDKNSAPVIDEDSDTLNGLKVKFNPLIGASGILIFMLGAIIQNMMVVVGAGIMAVVGVIHIGTQISNKDFRSKVSYNMGVSRFNKKDYIKANKFFEKSLKANPHNEHAEYAINKNSFLMLED